MITISTKELRNSFPTVLEQISHGEKFLLIHRSQPVAEISKPQNIKTFKEASEKDIEKASSHDISEDFLSQKELDYYLSLS